MPIRMPLRKAPNTVRLWRSALRRKPTVYKGLKKSVRFCFQRFGVFSLSLNPPVAPVVSGSTATIRPDGPYPEPAKTVRLQP
jgi:hypothetical protein